jgi:hypothetical protein
MPVAITLSPENLALARAEALRRQSQNEAKGLRGRNKAPDKGEKALKMHLLGCLGEVAVAELLGMQEHLFQAENAVRGAADLPGNIEVKTRSKHNYDLLVQLDDDPSKVFVLVTHEGGETAQVWGWIHGRDAARKEWIREFVRGRPCYAVPQKALNPIESIKDLPAESLPVRVLESHEAWLTRDGEDLILNFSQELSDKLGWRPGDTLEWDYVPESSKCVLRKADERVKASTGSHR